MRHYFMAFALAAGLSLPRMAYAQHESSEVTHDHHMMMMMMEQHHSPAAVDTLLSLRDTLQLTDRQVERLLQLKERGDQSEDHAMMDMNHGRMHRQWARVRFDRVPGKMVPRGHRERPGCCKTCPLMVLDKTQRQRAHEILGPDHEG